jgi:RNA polymerase sigma-70 factor (ECF subfamily)
MQTREVWTASALQEHFLQDVFRYVVRRVPQQQEAEDITAEVFAAAFEALARFRGDCGPRAWLLGIARRKVADAVRRRSRRRETLASEMPGKDVDELLMIQAPLDGPEELVERAEACRLLRKIVASLNADQREALLLQYVEDLAIAEIAVVMGRSAAAVNSLLQRARAAIFRQGRSYFSGTGED